MLRYNFITFEGIEGSGKTTQVQLLSKFLSARNIQHITTREPGGTSLAEEIRNILISGLESKLDGISETLLNITARYDHIKNLIKPSLLSKKIVLCDRFSDSTLAYQGFGHQIDLNMITTLGEKIIGNLIPDLTFLIDVEVTDAIRRIAGRKSNNRYEKMPLEFHERVRKGFLEIAGNNPQRVIVINGNQSAEAIQEQIINKLGF